MALAMVCALCGTFGYAAEKVATAPDKVLIAYYSWSPDGHTHYAAEQIQKATGGTLFEIKPKVPYPANYRACVDQARKECRAGFRPELSNPVKDMKQYEVIFVGSPNWCGTMAPPVRTFLTSYDFSGKTVIAFFTHGSGGMQNCERDVRKLLKKANLLPAKAFFGRSIRDANQEIADWVGSLLTVQSKTAKQ